MAGQNLMLWIAYKICLYSPRQARQGCLVPVEPWRVSAVQFAMKQPPINDPAYWRERAGEARRIAGQLADVVAKQAMLDIARSYEALAKFAEERPTTARSTGSRPATPPAEPLPPSPRGLRSTP